MNYPCFVVDDEQSAIDLLTYYIELHPDLDLVGTYLNSALALQQLVGGTISPAIVFMDVDMPDVTGLEITENLPDHIAVIITTGYREFAAEAFRHHAKEYLIKPFTYERFFKAVEYVKTLIPKPAEDPFLYVTSGKNQLRIKIGFQEIVYVEVMNKTLTIYLENEGFPIQSSLTSFMEIMPANLLIRVSQSFLVHRGKLRWVGAQKLMTTNGKEITIGPTYRKDFLDQIDERFRKG